MSALRGAIVVLEVDRGGAVGGGEGADVLHGRGAEGVDRLRVVAHHGEPTPVGPQAAQDLRLQHIGVLVLVYQNVVETGADLAREALVAKHGVPVKEQIVVVERLVRQLALDVGAVKARELRLPFRAPREAGRQRVGERALRIHAVRVDREAGVLARKAALGLGEAELKAHEVHEVGRVAAVEHAEVRREPELRAIAADQAVGDRMKGARPRQANRCRELTDDAARAPRHLDRGAAREREQQEALRIRALQDEMCHAMRERVGLSRARAREDQQRARSMARRRALRGV